MIFCDKVVIHLATPATAPHHPVSLVECCGATSHHSQLPSDHRLPQIHGQFWSAKVHQIQLKMSELSKFTVPEFVSTFQLFQFAETMTIDDYDYEGYFLIQQPFKILSDPDKPIFTI